MFQAIRTDLAAERLSAFQKSRGQGRGVEGVLHRRKSIHGLPIEITEICSQIAAYSLCKPVGLYYTIYLNKVLKRCDDSFIHGAQCISEILRELLPKGNRFLIACLGNPDITPDAIGPLCAKKLMVTRHLKSYMPDTFAEFSEVSLVCPGVLGTTGIESASIVKGAVETVKPDCVIVIDAMAACDISGLCNRVQICNTGIEPGSGVGNRRYALNKDTLGVPVISVGIPTIVDLSTLLYNVSEGDSCSLSQASKQMMVTPQNIDSLVSDCGKLLSYGINFALHPNLTLEDVDMFIG